MQSESDEVHVQGGVVHWQDEEILVQGVHVQVQYGGDKIHVEGRYVHGESHGPEKEHCPATTKLKEPPEKIEKPLEVEFCHVSTKLRDNLTFREGRHSGQLPGCHGDKQEATVVQDCPDPGGGYAASKVATDFVETVKSKIVNRSHRIDMQELCKDMLGKLYIKECLGKKSVYMENDDNVAEYKTVLAPVYFETIECTKLGLPEVDKNQDSVHLFEYFDCTTYQVDSSDVITPSARTLLAKLILQLQVNFNNPNVEVTLVINLSEADFTVLSMQTEIVGGVDFEVWHNTMQGTDMDRLNKIPMSVYTQLDLRCAWVFKGGG